jgi:hypothetical protein
MMATRKSKLLVPRSIIEAMGSDQLFRRWFEGPTWSNWQSIIKAINALPMSDQEIAFFRSVAGDRAPPTKPPQSVYIAVGRRGGKDSIATAHAAYDAAFWTGQDRLRPGERAQVLIIAPDKDTAKLSLGYLKSYFEEIPSLASMVKRTTLTGLELNNRVDVNVVSADFRLTRGRSILLAILTETAFMRDEHSAIPDVELFRALQPGLATLGGRIFCISSPYRKAGLLFDAYRQYFGRNGDDAVFIKAPTLSLNPSIDKAVIDAAFANDPIAAACEWGSEFRDDISSFVIPEIVDAAIVKGCQVIAPSGEAYVGFIDVSGGVRDSHCCAVAFKDQVTGASVLACARELKSADTESVVAEFATLLKSYGLDTAYADRYGAEWVRNAFERHGIDLRKSPHDRSGLYLNVLPALNAGQVKLLDLPRLRSQLLSLERRTLRGSGKDVVDHPTAGADDLINACAGSLVLAATADARRVRWHWTSAGPPGGPRIIENNIASLM